MIRVKDLKDQVNTPFPRPSLYRERCGEHYSANKGDYFMADPDTIMKCCQKPMALVVRRTVLTRVLA